MTVDTRYQCRRCGNLHDYCVCDDPSSNGDGEPALQLTVVTVQKFAETDEPGGEALLGSSSDNVIPANGDVMIYGAGGAGKTTLGFDLGCHLCAALGWLGLTVARALRGLIIENEGPRPNLRGKFKAKLAHWDQIDVCPDLGDRLTIVEEPWAELRLDRASHRQGLADEIRAREIDFVIIGPLATSGMVGHGTIEEVRNFLACLADVRRRAGRQVAFIVVHHENRAGQVSGAWEGAGDTLIHVRKRSHGRTGLHVDKARWAPAWHGKTLELLWRDGERYEVEAKPELSDDDIAEKIVDALGGNPGIGWTQRRGAHPWSGQGPAARRPRHPAHRRHHRQRRQGQRRRNDHRRVPRTAPGSPVPGDG